MPPGAAFVKDERLNALGSMASGVVHDLGNALSPIIGYSDLLLTGKSAGKLSPEAGKYFNRIQFASNGALHMVNRLRTFSQPTSAETPFSAVDLRAVVEETLALSDAKRKMAEQANEAEIKVRHIGEETPPIQGNNSELREALTDLAFNAMPHGGTVTVRRWQAPGHAIIQVAETGQGMNEDVLERCFEPFFADKGERGTALGLTMVRGIVQRHGGDVHVESHVGQGTTFERRFPLTGKRG